MYFQLYNASYIVPKTSAYSRLDPQFRVGSRVNVLYSIQNFQTFCSEASKPLSLAALLLGHFAPHVHKIVVDIKRPSEIDF